MSGRVRIVIADDHAMLREGVRRVLADVDDFEIVAEVASGGEALEAISTRRPAVALLDLSMPDVGGIEIVERAKETSPDTRVLILSMHSDGDAVAGALAAGALGYLLKDEAGPAELRAAVRAAAAGDAFFSPSIASILAAEIQPKPSVASESPGLDTLTDRERDVLLGIAEGLSNKQLSARLGIGRRTVETHRETLMRKLGIRTVAGLTRFAISAGLIDAGPP